MKIIILVIAMLSLQACGFEIVDTGHRGVKITNGKVDESMGSVSEGLYFFAPFITRMAEVDVRTQKWSSKTSTFTKDVQVAEIDYTLNYNLDPAYAHTTYRDVGKDWADKLIPQVVNSRLKDTVGKWEASELVSKRDIAGKTAEQSIIDDLVKSHIIVTKFEITNIDYSDAFEKSVEDKQVAIQRAIEEKNRTVQKQEQANQVLIAATAEAKAIRIRGEALKANAALIDYQAIEKWDGKLPVYMLGGNTTPFIKLNK